MAGVRNGFRRPNLISKKADEFLTRMKKNSPALNTTNPVNQVKKKPFPFDWQVQEVVRVPIFEIGSTGARPRVLLAPVLESGYKVDFGEDFAYIFGVGRRRGTPSLISGFVTEGGPVGAGRRRSRITGPRPRREIPPVKNQGLFFPNPNGSAPRLNFAPSQSGRNPSRASRARRMAVSVPVCP